MTVTESTIYNFAAEALPSGKCWKCSYDLRGITSRRCPECGWSRVQADALSSPQGTRLMKPTRWIGRAAMPLAAVALLLDALLLPTPVTLLLLAVLWIAVAGPYIFRARRRKNILFRPYAGNLVIDPDLPARKRIATVFLIVAMVVWSGLWQRAMICISLPWLNAYAEHLYADEPLLAPLRSSTVWCGVLPVTALRKDPIGISLRAGFGALKYLPQSDSNGAAEFSFEEGGDYWDTIFTRISPNWYIGRPPWNFLKLTPSLNR